MCAYTQGERQVALEKQEYSRLPTVIYRWIRAMLRNGLLVTHAVEGNY